MRARVNRSLLSGHRSFHSSCPFFIKHYLFIPGKETPSGFKQFARNSFYSAEPPDESTEKEYTLQKYANDALAIYVSKQWAPDDKLDVARIVRHVSEELQIDDGDADSVYKLCEYLFVFTGPFPDYRDPISQSVFTRYKERKKLPQPVLSGIISAALCGHCNTIDDVATLESIEALDTMTMGRELVEEAICQQLDERSGADAAVLRYLLIPDDQLCYGTPQVRDFLNGLLEKEKSTPSTGLQTTDAEEDVEALTQHICQLCGTDVMVVARRVARRIAHVMARRNRAKVLFAPTLEQQLESCALIALCDKSDTYRKAVVDKILCDMKEMKPSIPPEDEEPASATNNTIPKLDDDAITYENFLEHDKWPPGFTRTAFSEKDRSFNLQYESRIFEIQLLSPVPGSDTKLCVSYDTVEELVMAKWSALFGTLIELAQPWTPVFDELPFSSLAYKLRKDEVWVPYNAGLGISSHSHYRGCISASMVGMTRKRSLTAVYGYSGVGKTVFSCMTVPYKMRLSETTHVVLHTELNDDNSEVIANIKEAHRSHIEKLEKCTPVGQLKRMFALAALRRRGDVLPEESTYPGWRDYCDEQLKPAGVDKRKSIAKEYVLDQLKTLLKERTNYKGIDRWIADNSNIKKYKGAVILVIDEIGKSVELARAIIAAQYDLYEDPWVRSHMARLEIVLCGTGAEVVVTPSFSLDIATDPSAVNCIEVTGPHEDVIKALFLRAFGMIPTPLNIEKMLKEVEGFAPQLCEQTKSPLFKASKANMRLHVLVCSLLDLMWSYLHTERQKEIEQKSIDPIKEYEYRRRMDSTLARVVGLDGLMRMALLKYTRCNGLGHVRGENDLLAIDTALTYSLRHVAHPLLPLPALHAKAALLQKASKLGILVYGKDLPSTAITAIVTFAFSEPGETLDGYELEQFTAQWASRLLQVQSGLSVAVGQLPFCVPWGRKRSPQIKDLDSLVAALRRDRALVVLNGTNAPGADIIVVQLRPSYDVKLSARMSLDEYRRTWPDWVIASLTIISCKRTGDDLLAQLVTLGVINLSLLIDLANAEHVDVLTRLFKLDADDFQREKDKNQPLTKEEKERYLEVLKKNKEKYIHRQDYHNGGPLLMALVAAMALEAEATTTEEKLAEDLTALLANPTVDVAECRKLYRRVLESKKIPDNIPVDKARIVVRPRLVYGGNVKQQTSWWWAPCVLEGAEFSWACAEENGDWLCPPESFGPLKEYVEVKAVHK